MNHLQLLELLIPVTIYRALLLGQATCKILSVHSSLHWILVGGRDCDSHFIDEETEVQRSLVTFPLSHEKYQDSNLGSPCSKAHAVIYRWLWMFKMPFRYEGIVTGGIQEGVPMAFCSAWCPSSCETEALNFRCPAHIPRSASFTQSCWTGKHCLMINQSQTNPGGPFQVRNGDLISLKGDGKIRQKKARPVKSSVGGHISGCESRFCLIQYDFKAVGLRFLILSPVKQAEHHVTSTGYWEQWQSAWHVTDAQ